MNAEQLNIDDFVDYAAEYKGVLKNARITGDRIIGHCPFHNDNRNSFTADLRTGRCHCFTGCIDGNFISFWARLHEIDTKEAYKRILEKYGKLDETKPQEKKKQQMQDYTLSEYALTKRLPEDFLKNVCLAETGRDRDGTRCLKLPYRTEGGDVPVFRKRYGNKEFRWSYGSSGKLILYGEWRLAEIRQQGYAVLAEGESDTQTLWFLKFAAFGVPGASNFKANMVSKLEGLKLYIHVEPDRGGETFLEKVCRILHEEGYAGDVYTWSCGQFGVKDPSELYIRDGEERAQEKIQKALQKAKKIEIDDVTDIIPAAVQGAPVNLRQPGGWIYSEKGISHIDEKRMIPSMVCRTPVILTQRLKSLETGEEKIEIAFKRDGKWQTAIFPRSTIFTSRSITVLADLGCTVTSENAKMLVRFLEALEAENIDIITRADSTSTFGWQTRGRFLPGHGNDIVLDIEQSLKGWAAAYHASGTLEKWIQNMSPHRERDKFRFILASSFAPPLLRIIQQRNMLVYNWGGSKGGKTAALKAALSAWGEPERLMVNFNATQVALERMAGFFCDLPLGIDERQLAGQKQDRLESIVYMLGSGTGRARGSKGGGLQALNTWRTIAIATGEEPLSTETTKTGVSTRVLEIYGGPFDDEKSASMMHQQAASDYGHAGPEYIRRVMETDERSIAESYVRMTEEIYHMSGGTSGAHIAGIAAVALADAMVETWMFSESNPQRRVSDNGKQELCFSEGAWKRAVQMAQTIIKEQLSSGIVDVNENATQFIVDWILSNRNQFGDRAVGVCFGTISSMGDKAYLFPSLLNQALMRAGYSPRKTLKHLGDNGIISSTLKANGSREYCVRKWFDGRTQRMVEFDIGRFAESVDALDEDAAAETISGGAQNGLPPAAIEIENENEWRQISVDEMDQMPFDTSEQEELPF